MAVALDFYSQEDISEEIKTKNFALKYSFSKKKQPLITEGHNSQVRWKLNISRKTRS
jgi:hypothetical protein